MSKLGRSIVKIGMLIPVLALSACTEEEVFVPVPDGGAPDAPRNLDAHYFNRTVVVNWELGPLWNGEPFRVYSKRVTDASHFFIAEVSSCSQSLCTYIDRNIVAGVRYNYFVSAVDPDTGIETDSDVSIDVDVPQPIPPDVPAGPGVIALDNSNFVQWASNARGAGDFSHYRVFLSQPGGPALLLGETDSEGFLDLLAENGVTSSYFVTSVDDQGHESAGSSVAQGTPRPDFSGEVMFAFQDVPTESGFRFQESEDILPVVNGLDIGRHFRLERDQFGWWLVPGPRAEVNLQSWGTTALKCGPGSDFGCIAVEVAPVTGYTGQAIALSTQTSYVLRVEGEDGLTRYGVIRVELLGFDQFDDGLMIFDWAYQIQPGNTGLIRIAESTY